ncbi:MAG: WYL domain-containing protein, partial [Clostridia bacterium]
VFRYIDILAEAGVPIVTTSGRGGGIAIVGRFKLPATYFTADEYNLLLSATKSFAIQNTLAEEVSTKLQTLRRGARADKVLSSEQFVVVPPEKNDDTNEFFTQISQSLLTHNLLKIDYHATRGESEEREIEPLSLVFADNIWYLYAFCRLRNDFRFFKINRIARLNIMKQQFSPRPFFVDTDRITKDVIRNTEKVSLVLQVMPSARVFVEEWLGMNSVVVSQETLLASATLPLDDLLIKKILSFGRGIKVLSPLSLARKVVDEADALKKLYIE